MTSGITYAAYQTASRASIKPSVEAYNKQNPDSIRLDPAYAHLLLGYFWTVSGKPAWAFAEADLAEESKEANVKYLAQSLRSVTMYQQGWHTLSQQEATYAKQSLSRETSSYAVAEAIAFYLIMGTLYVNEKDFAQAKFFWAGFGNETGIHWPYQLCDAAADWQAGNLDQALSKLKTMSQDPAVPTSLREALLESIGKIEQHAGASIDSSLFWPKLIAVLLWEELQKSSNPSLRRVTDMISGFREKLPV